MENMECSGEIPPPRCQVGAFLVQNNRYLVIYGGAYRKQRVTPDDELVEAYGDIVRDVDEIYVLDIQLRHWVRSTPALGSICCQRSYFKRAYLHKVIR
jgi:hypothetical protein